MGKNPINPGGIKLVRPEGTTKLRATIIPNFGGMPIRFLEIIRWALERDSEEVDVLGKRRRALLGRVFDELDTGRAANGVGESMREFDEARFTN